MKTKRFFNVAVVYWVDAALHGTNQVSEDDAKGYGLMAGFSAGIIVYENKEYITIAGDFFPEQSNNEKNNYRNLSSIPKSGISKIKRYKLQFK